jgi:hypothetical protein
MLGSTTRFQRTARAPTPSHEVTENCLAMSATGGNNLISIVSVDLGPIEVPCPDEDDEADNKKGNPS